MQNGRKSTFLCAHAENLLLLACLPVMAALLAEICHISVKLTHVDSPLPVHYLCRLPNLPQGRVGIILVNSATSNLKILINYNNHG
jgi:hypothetical protein